MIPISRNEDDGSICGYGDIEKREGNYYHKPPTELFLQYEFGFIKKIFSKNKLEDLIGVTMRNSKNYRYFDINILNKYFTLFGNKVCITPDDTPRNFDRLQPVSSTLFHIKRTALNCGDNIRKGAREREILKYLGKPIIKNEMRKTLVEHYHIEHLFFDKEGDYSYKEKTEILATNERGETIPYNSMNECAIAFDILSTETINISIRLNEPIPYNNVLWYFTKP